MIVAFDNTFLTSTLNPDSAPRPNPKTGKPVDHCSLRVEALIDTLSKQSSTVLIPSPCLAEILIAVPDVQKALEEIDKSSAFEIAPFDARSAIELAEATRNALASGDKRLGRGEAWQKVKMDRQIAAIAKVNGADILYTDDDSQSYFASVLDMQVKHTWDLDLPPKYAQMSFPEDPTAKPRKT